MGSSLPGVPHSQDILNEGDRLDLISGIAPSHKGQPNMDNFHAVAIRGLLNVERLRQAVDALQERHPRMRARFYENPFTGYNYLLRSDARVPLDVREGSYKTINVDLERELMVPIDALRGPFCRFAYIRHPEDCTGLVIFHQNHGVGDGRACEILLSQLLKLYDGKDVAYFSNTRSLAQMREVRHDRLKKYHYIEAGMPRRGPNSIIQTFVDPKHPSFDAKFEGVCIEIARLDAAHTQRLLQACRRHQSTVTSAVGAAVAYAVVAELLKRRRITEHVTIGMTMNERGRSLGPEFNDEAGNLITDLHLHCQLGPNFWESAETIAKSYGEVLREDCTFEATVTEMPEFQQREILMLLRRASPDHVVGMTGDIEHVNMASYGVLKRYVEYEGFEVLENFTGSHLLFMPCKVNLCTSGSSGRFTACVMVTRNVVPHARELACRLRDRLQETLEGLLADEGGPENARTLRWCAEISAAMECKVKQRQAELALAPKSNDGTVFQGDYSGNFNCTSHLKIFINVMFCLVSGGGLSGFPIYQPEMARIGVFNHVCPPLQDTCKAQDDALSALFANGMYATMSASFFGGYLFDTMGARYCAVFGALLSSVCMVVIGFAICIDARTFPNIQVVLLYVCYILGDMGELLSALGLLGWIWHYPRRQTFMVGLQNGAYQASSIFGILFVWMVSAGFSLQQGFFVIGFTNLLAAIAFFYCTPSSQEFFHEAAKVLDRHAAGLNQAAFAGCLHLKAQLKSTWGVIKLFPCENFVFIIGAPLASVYIFWWQATFASRFDEWFGSSGAHELGNFFASVYSPLGIFLNPASGLFMDIVGLPMYLCVCVCVGLTLAIAEPLRSVAGQKLAIFAMSCCVGIMQNVEQRWCMIFGPPQVFGTWLGIMATWSGMGAIVINAFLGTDSNGIVVLLICMDATLNLTMAVVLKVRGVPKHPPKNMYDSPDYLRDHRAQTGIHDNGKHGQLWVTNAVSDAISGNGCGYRARGQVGV